MESVNLWQGSHELNSWLCTLHSGILTASINRPQVKNALDSATWQELGVISRLAAADSAVKVLIITGTGDSFAAGADLRWLKDRPVAETLQPGVQGYLLELENMPKPVVAAVNGYAMGGGAELALACDIRIASDTAKFGFGEINVGIIPGGGGTQRLTRLVGSGWAKQLIFSGKPINANLAERIGLVNEVVPGSNLLSRALELATLMALKPPLALQLAKAAINLGNSTDLQAGLAFEKACQSFLHTTDDRNEGMTAFLEKRPPVFQGR